MGQKLVFQIPKTGVTLALFKEFVVLCEMHEVSVKSMVALESREDGLRFVVPLSDSPSRLPGRNRKPLSHDEVKVMRSIIQHRIKVRHGKKIAYVPPVVNSKKKYVIRKSTNG